MAFADSPEDKALRDAWRLFCARLQDAGERAFKDYNPANPLQRADAFRFLTQNLGQAFDLALETKDPRFPLLHAFCTPTRKLGGDAADFTYHQAWIDGRSVYKIAGHKGTARFLNFTIQGARPEKQPGTEIRSLHDPFGDIPEANLFGHQMQTAPDGRFELYIGGEQRGPNWLATTPATRKLFVRQGFDDWSEAPWRFSIERLDMNEPRPPPTPQVMVEAMDWAGNFVTGLMNDWPDHPYEFSEFVDPVNVNAFPEPPRSVDGSDQKRGRAVANLCWRLEPDEALIVEFAPPDSFWMLTNMGAFFSSMDYLYRPVSYTPARTKLEADGKARLILAHDDPGYHNWIDTQGFEAGALTYRNLLSTAYTSFATRLVKRAELAAALPADAAKITPDERAAQMRARFDAIRRRYNL